ncbi:MAG TPA: hypothetical protein VJH92_00775 [Candidatus Nanoarchaeia archaeon]|nr:hypothetical protein [Candidatus Nanoarchaeia archaeon]
MRLVVFAIMFFFFGSLLIISNNDLPLNSQENFHKFGVLCLEWTDKVFDNFGKLSGSVVSMDWNP